MKGLAALGDDLYQRIRRPHVRLSQYGALFRVSFGYPQCLVISLNTGAQDRPRYALILIVGTPNPEPLNPKS